MQKESLKDRMLLSISIRHRKRTFCREDARNFSPIELFNTVHCNELLGATSNSTNPENREGDMSL